MQMNRVEIASYLTKRPELRYLPSGTPVANARLGQTYRYEDSANKSHECTNWHQLSFYGDLAKLVANYEKGSNLFVHGTIQQREFTPKDGSKRVINEIVVRHCHLIAPPRAAAAASPASGSAAAEPVPNLEGAPDDDWPVR
jgi:single-strand DNA-binding protein